ncbi:tetratricopeptide repeat protein [Micromonospora humi]|uniref:tetratricopeptide repeat protein n=1 Tax=Micromonospora humi TaxID=745366 RepID=UPI00158670E6|nr:tetratricopeptide repeat protein [Micromonospora humi]
MPAAGRDFSTVNSPRHDHPDTLGSINSPAGAYQAVGRIEEAISLFERVLR